MNKLSKKQIWVLLFLFFIIRIVWCLIFGWKEIDPGSDGPEYNSSALHILKDWSWLIHPDFLGHYRPPVYPVFLAIIYHFFGAGNLKAVFFFQAIINTITVYYIFKLSSHILGERNSYLSLLWSGIYVLYFYWIGRLYRETLVWFFLIFSFYQLWLFFETQKSGNLLRNKHAWLFLISFVLLVHTDGRFLFYVPFFIILFVIFFGFSYGIKQYAKILLIFLLMLVPWTIRNYFAYKGFVLISTWTLDLRKNKEEGFIARLRHLYSNNKTERYKCLNPDYPSEEEIRLIKKGLNPRNRPKYEIELIRKGKLPATTYIGRKLYFLARMWLPFKFSWDYYPFPYAYLNKPWSLKHNIVSILLYGTLLPFFFFSLFYLIKKGRSKAVLFLSFPIWCHFLLHFLMWGKERYRIQIDAFIIILGCYGIQIFIGYMKRILCSLKQ